MEPDVELVGGVEQRSIEGALATTPHVVRHIGSTSVPGLSAKAIVDMALSLASTRVEDEAAYLPALERPATPRCSRSSRAARGRT